MLLDCISAFYPLFLALLTLVLHARNFRLLVILWKPVHKYFANCRRKLDPKSSVIAATFMSQSFSKILAIAFLAMYSTSYNISNKPLRRGLYDPSIQSTTAEYWKQLIATPYFFPLFNCPATYSSPLKAFRQLLMCCGSSRYHAIYAFIDTFQGHYKDGTNGSRDYRAASSISFLLKTLFCAILSNPYFRHGVPTHSLGNNNLTSILVIVSLFYGIIQSCKRK